LYHFRPLGFVVVVVFEEDEFPENSSEVYTPLDGRIIFFVVVVVVGIF